MSLIDEKRKEELAEIGIDVEKCKKITHPDEYVLWLPLRPVPLTEYVNANSFVSRNSEMCVGDGDEFHEKLRERPTQFIDTQGLVLSNHVAVGYFTQRLVKNGLEASLNTGRLLSLDLQDAVEYCQAVYRTAGEEIQRGDVHSLTILNSDHVYKAVEIGLMPSFLVKNPVQPVKETARTLQHYASVRNA